MIGQKIKELRIEKGLSQMSLSYESGVTQGRISQIENGQCRPSVDTLKKLAEVFEIEPIELIKYYVVD